MRTFNTNPFSSRTRQFTERSGGFGYVNGGLSGRVQVHDDQAIFQESPDELPVIDIHCL